MKEKEMIFGIRAVMEAVEAEKEIDKVIVKRELQGDLSKELFAMLKSHGISVQRVPNERLDRFTRKNHQGVIAFLSAVAYEKIENIIPFLYESGKDPFILVLDGITDVRNFGAIARTCEVAGVDAIVIPAKGSVTVNADAVKTSAGALLKIPVCKEPNITSVIRFLKNSGIKVVAAGERGVDMYTAVDYTGPVAFVMGAEDVGVANENLRIADNLVRIPHFGSIGSLNVSVAAGVLVYEAIRQKGLK
ncbi:MAG: 23S rRNA (guanosine(2251)-2'-O)-methyltransferase RlmB [Prevotella sp.]|jgi:23S rRNA (guanosine2251-2'-O)-methyltransferase|nr:23S rRNA (guanosine(2251)-2'-O)-methyltransferase RlmB [Prevotella sp.]